MLVSRAACALRPNRPLCHSSDRMRGLHGLVQTLHCETARRYAHCLTGSSWNGSARSASNFARALRTNPGQRLVVGGSCGILTISSNYESEVANVQASRDGVPILLEDAARVTVDDDGNINVFSTGASSSLAIDVPAMFNVSANIDGRCDVKVDGWIEGTVDVTVGEGNVGVNTVRGMQTTIRTGDGNIAVKTVEGNLDVKTGKGEISLGKILGEIVHVRTDEGGVEANAIYAKDALVSATGSLRVQALCAELSRVDIGGGSVLSSVDGAAEVVLRGGSVQVEAANTLRSLQLRAESSSDHTQAGTVKVCLSKECVAEAQVVASRLALDEALFMQERSKTAAKSDEMRIISFGPPEAHLTATTPCSVTIHAPEHLVSFSVMDFFRKFKLNK